MKHWVPGPIAVVAIASLAVLAHGIPGVADGESPSRHYMETALEKRLRADEKLFPIGESKESEALIEDVFGDGKRPTNGRAYTRDYRKLAYRIAKNEGIRRPKLFVRQIAAESGMQPCVRSGAGAIGIAQIMPSTARSWHVDPYMPEQALRAAARNMHRYEKQLGSQKLALAAYNAGPGAVQAYGGVPPYSETREYIHRIRSRSYPLLGMKQVYHLPGGMQTGFASRLGALKRDVKRHGGHLRVNEGWRSYEDQLRLWKVAKKRYGGWEAARRWVAPPGCSNHNRGWAADLAGNLRLAHRLAGRHGLEFPMAHEPWHIELANIPTQSGS
jgi:soluble lytic murein transglycosylase-like protein